MLTITHTKVNNVTDWTQAQLNTIIAGGAAPLPPAGTVLNDVVLPSDWNHNHDISGNFDDAYIKLNGTSTTTAAIPFAQGANFSGAVTISALTPSFIFSASSGETLSLSASGGQIGFVFSNGVSDPDYLTWTATLLAFTSTLQGNQLKSTQATGTAPIIVASTTKVTNLNADLLDGKDTGTSGNSIPLLDGVNTWSGAQTFLDGKLLARNSANTFSATFSTPVTAARTITFFDASATVAGLSVAQTWSAAQLFGDTLLTLRNTANTFTGTFTCAITAARTWTMPNATTTIPGLSQSNTFTGTTQTISTSASSIFALTNTGTPRTFQLNLTSGIFTFKNSTDSFTFLTIDVDGNGNNLLFNSNDGTTFQTAGVNSIAFQATTFYFNDSGGTANSSWEFGTNGTINFRIGGTTEHTLTAGNFTFKDGYTIKSGTTTGLKICDSTSQKLGFFNATPVVRQTDGAALTNNVTSGGTTDTIANYTDLIIYANDSAAIRNDIYQLARKIKIVDDALRTYGLLS